MQLDLCQQVGDGWKVPPIPAEVFNVNVADRAWVDRQCTFQPLATFQQPVLRTASPRRREKITYVLATGWEGSPFPQFHERAQADGWGSITLDGGHDLMLDKPAEVVADPAGRCSPLRPCSLAASIAGTELRDQSGSCMSSSKWLLGSGKLPRRNRRTRARSRIACQVLRRASAGHRHYRPCPHAAAPFHAGLLRLAGFSHCLGWRTECSGFVCAAIAARAGDCRG